MDLKEKQKKFEGLDKNAEEVTTGINFQTEYVRENISVSCSELINRFNLLPWMNYYVELILRL